MGSNCEATCPFPTYGEGCQMKCNCIDKDCDPVNGCNKSSSGVHMFLNALYLLCRLQLFINEC